MASSTVQIELTEKEQELFELLLASIAHTGAQTVVRVAGGWVRDKVLRQQSCDIDVALNDQSGVEFANHVNDYLKHVGLETRTIAVIQANPDQSKHLETANLRVLGYEIDCVNLRAETYTDSRIPEIRNGTALEDALRRDFTVNALFYNINTKVVEDLTERGLPDLQLGVIRTPISAHITFYDDPLRVLRAIRFASRFNFALDAELVAAASSAQIRAAINEKVSRERVYKECEGCMTKENSRPYLAFTLMHRLNLLDVVLPLRSVLAHSAQAPGSAFAPEKVEHIVTQWLHGVMGNMYWVNLLLALRARGDFSVGTTASASVSAAELAVPKFGTSVKTLFWCAATGALAGLQVLEKGKPVSLIPVLLREGLKMENSTMKNVQTMTESVAQFQELERSADVSVDLAGALLRSCKELWRDCILLACAMELAVGSSHQPSASSDAGAGQQESGVKRPYSAAGAESAGAEETADHVANTVSAVNAPIFVDCALSEEVVSVMERYSRLEARILEMGLDNIWLLKPLMNGNELIKELGLPKGPMVGKLVELQTQWQVRNPASSDKAALLAHLRTVLPSIL